MSRPTTWYRGIQAATALADTSLYAHSSIPAAVRPEKVSLHPPESYPSALGY
ncbi:MAG: hypothetical protein ABW166_21015 [Sedimenticola sp.]